MTLNTVRNLHVTPGIYQKETELMPSIGRSGVTTLGLVGETLKGPAFSPIYVSNWKEYTEVFGSTSTELYKGSKYPRYELPYIAKSYLTESNNLIVTRVLGLSGYHAGKAWLLKSIGSGDGDGMLVGVIRSRGHYVKTFGYPSYSDQIVKSGDIEKYVQYIVGRINQSSDDPIPNTDHITYDGKNYLLGEKFFGTDKTNYTITGSNLAVYGYCGTNYDYDKLIWDADEVYIAPSGQASTKFTCGKSGVWQNAQFSGISSTQSDLGTFRLIVKLKETCEFVEYTVSLNPGRKDYIYKVLGGSPGEGNTPIWIEELYDVAFQQLVYKNGVDPKNYIEGILLHSKSGSVDQILVQDGGSNWNNPIVEIVDVVGPGETPGFGATAYATISPGGEINEITINAPGGGGSGYVNPVINIVDKKGVGATAIATTDGSGIITSIKIISAGSGYINPHIVITEDGTAGSGANITATANPVNVISSITVTNKGTGYSNPQVKITDTPVITSITVDTPINLSTLSPAITNPVFTLTDPTGSGAIFTPVFGSPNVITDIVVVNPGLNYTAPVYTITDSDSSITSSVTISTISTPNKINLTSGNGSIPSGSEPIANIDIKQTRVIDGGANYPVVTISDTGIGTGAIAVATISSGGLNSIDILAGGDNYTSSTVSATIEDSTGTPQTIPAANIHVKNGKVTSIDTTGILGTYPTLQFTDTGSGSGMNGYATIDANGKVATITITSSGSGYTNPLINFTVNTTAKAEFLYNGLIEAGEADTIISQFKPVKSILNTPNQALTKTDLNDRYLYSYNESLQTDYIEEIINVITSPTYSITTTKANKTLGPDDDGKILVVKEDVDSSGKRTYNYHYVITATSNGVSSTYEEERLLNQGFNTNGTIPKYVYVTDQKLFYEIETFVPIQQYPYNHIVQRVVGDISDYKEPYRYAVTPWIVSQIYGTYANNEVKKLFRFYTLSAGDTANTLYKVSIMNIDPERLTFDVVVRDFNDTDASIVILEQFKSCTLNPSNSNYILNKIGSLDNSTPQKSKYIMVEVADNETIRYAIPAGYLGLPVRDLGVGFKKPYIAFNTTYYPEIKENRQFFGFSDVLGIDVDILKYSGRTTYTDGLYTDGFHLDSRVTNCNTLVDGENPGVDCKDDDQDFYINGVFTWQTPSVDEVGTGGNSPAITSEEDIVGTIYEKAGNRKFTVCFYGGFDAWDPYRTYRTTGDSFKYSKYKGKINPNTGEGEHFDILTGDTYGISEKAITSDYYAFWAGHITLSNQNETPINVLASPGIDYVNDTLLVSNIIDIVEDDINQKTIYIVTTPDKPLGADDQVKNMFSAEDVVGNLEATEIDSSYTATYYPWVRYYDENEKKTIFLPPTRDVVRSLASIDNKSYVWYPPAGSSHALLNDSTARKFLKINEEDTLYAGRINFLKTYARDGVYLWGQKTLKISYYDDREALTRIGVRRMMIRIKELVQRANRQLLFTPNDISVAAKFDANTRAILTDVKSNGGISDFRIETEVTAESREARTLPVRIYIKPESMLEYIEIDWVITPQGMQLNSFG